MCHTCGTCGQPVVRLNDKRPWPHKCRDCKKEAQREYQRRYREKTRPRVDWSGLTCADCGVILSPTNRRGTPSKRCRECRCELDRKRRAAKRRAAKAEGKWRHFHRCEHCGIRFGCESKHQKCCSTICAHTMARKRLIVTCEKCGKRFEMCEAYATRRRFCSMECCKASASVHDKKCLGCGLSFRRWVSKRFPHRDAGKYCSRECYLDHRWGKDRPGQKIAKCLVEKASRCALATSLRKKCKILGVPFDPECTRQAVCDRDGWRCQKCGVRCNREYIIDTRTRRVHHRNAEHDHIIPLTDHESPGNVFPNSQCLCRRCNGRKSDTRWGQLRLDLEGSVTRWADAVAGRNRRNSRSSVAIQAVVP